jgi:uncharacterized membrane protein YeaQ/YmgE (transglycosylase-associated protein family)
MTAKYSASDSGIIGDIAVGIVVALIGGWLLSRFHINWVLTFLPRSMLKDAIRALLLPVINSCAAAADPRGDL